MTIDTRASSAPTDYMPIYTPHLHKIKSKDPVELENHGYVSDYVNIYIKYVTIMLCVQLP